MQAAIKKLDYRRNENAISLVKNETKTLGVIMPDLATSFSGTIINGIEDTAYAEGYSVILMHAGVEGNRLIESLNLMAERRVAGLVIVSIALTSDQSKVLQALGIPFILLSTEAIGHPFPYLKVDDYTASYHAVTYLIEKGHRGIALAGASPTDPIAGKPRIRGYRDAMEFHGLAVKEEWIQAGDFSFEAGKQALAHLKDELDQLTAVFCVSDEVALGVIAACFANGIRVPDDLSVVGYDNSPIASMSIPPLTTIAQPFYYMGQTGCTNLIQSIRTGRDMLSQITPFELIERDSVRDLRNK